MLTQSCVHVSLFLLKTYSDTVPKGENALKTFPTSPGLNTFPKQQILEFQTERVCRQQF